MVAYETLYISHEGGTYVVETFDNNIVLVAHDSKLENIIALVVFVILVALLLLFRGSS